MRALICAGPALFLELRVGALGPCRLPLTSHLCRERLEPLLYAIMQVRPGLGDLGALFMRRGPRGAGVDLRQQARPLFLRDVSVTVNVNVNDCACESDREVSVTVNVNVNDCACESDREVFACLPL